jgi:hypothetical protein
VVRAQGVTMFGESSLTTFSYDRVPHLPGLADSRFLYDSMTSFMIAQFIDRKVSEAWLDDNCRFCKIIQGVAPAYVVYETDEIIAFLGAAQRIVPFAIIDSIYIQTLFQYVQVTL